MCRSALLGLAALCASAMASAAPAEPLPPAPPAVPAPAVPDQIWLVGDQRVLFKLAPIAFPLKAGTLLATNHKEASRRGENLDNAIEYRSPDGAVFATIYIYYPGLAHAGLAAIAEDAVIRQTWPNVTGGEMKPAAAGGIDGVAIRASYAHYFTRDLASAAAYLKAGRWLVTIRVSGPEQRRSEVEAAMDGLLRGIQFGSAAPARPAAFLTVRDCAQSPAGPPAKALPDPPGASIAAYGFLGTFDGAGIEARDNKTGVVAPLPSRVPTDLCRTSLKLPRGAVTLLRGEDGEAISIDGRTVRAALLSDSGRILEVDHARNLGGYVVLSHGLGETDLLGLYDGIPSDQQLADIIDGSDREGGRIRVPVRFPAGRGPEMMLPPIPRATTPAPAQAAPAQTPAASSR